MTQALFDHTKKYDIRFKEYKTCKLCTQTCCYRMYRKDVELMARCRWNFLELIMDHNRTGSGLDPNIETTIIQHPREKTQMLLQERRQCNLTLINLSFPLLFFFPPAGWGSHHVVRAEAAEDADGADHLPVQVCLPGPHPVPQELPPHLSLASWKLWPYATWQNGTR